MWTKLAQPVAAKIQSRRKQDQSIHAAGEVRVGGKHCHKRAQARAHQRHWTLRNSLDHRSHLREHARGGQGLELGLVQVR